MAQETFEEFSRRVSYSIDTSPLGDLCLKCVVRLPYGTLANYRPLYIVDALSDEQKAFFIILKARQGLNRLWEALQNREVRGAE
jgi:hypothetical protein